MIRSVVRMGIFLVIAAAATWLLHSAGVVEIPVFRQSIDGDCLEVELYFSDSQAMYLVPETRKITADARGNLAAVVLQELIAGPRSKDLWHTVPESTGIRSVEVRDGVAYVDLSEDYRSGHWGGSTGDLMTTYSIVNTLTRLDGISAVQLLIEGRREEAILGHVDTSRPLTFNSDLVKQHGKN